MTSYNKGVAAYYNGDHDNPYHRGQSAFAEWQHGHDDAQRDDQRND